MNEPMYGPDFFQEPHRNPKFSNREMLCRVLAPVSSILPSASWKILVNSESSKSISLGVAQWLLLCWTLGLLQLGQCWFAIRALLQLLTPLQSPLLAVLLESLGILLFIFLVYKPLSNGYIVRSRQRRFLFWLCCTLSSLDGGGDNENLRW